MPSALPKDAFVNQAAVLTLLEKAAPQIRPAQAQSQDTNIGNDLLWPHPCNPIKVQVRNISTAAPSIPTVFRVKLRGNTALANHALMGRAHTVRQIYLI